MRIPALAAGIAALVLLAGCGGDDDQPDPKSADRATGTETAVAEPPATASDLDARTPDGAKEGLDPSKDVVNGSQDPRKTGAARRVRAALATFFGGLARQDPRTVCSTYTRKTRKFIGAIIAKDCPTAMRFAYQFLLTDRLEKTFGRVKVKRVVVRGRRATARLHYPRKLRAVTTFQFITKTKALRLEKEAGAWRLGLPSL